MALYQVGIVGRTGAGKSSILNALFRLNPVCGGRIVLDGIDIVGIPVRDLRSKLVFVPQSSFLFEGSLRANLDPYETSSDDKIWETVEKCCLKDEIEAAGRLDIQVKESGTTFSVGQQQLLCLARSLLKPSKVLCLDEFTANVDTQTASKLQKAIASECRSRTIVTIAHRISTVVTMDQILIFDQGSLVGEYARRFSSLLAYVPHVSGRERSKRNLFLEGLNEDLYSLVLQSSPTSYADAVDKTMDIEEGLRNHRSPVQPQAVQGTHPNTLGVQPPQFPQSSQQQPQQSAQQSGRHRFRPCGHQFKKKQGSSSSGSGSSSSISSPRATFCGQCEGRHPSTQCTWVQGACNICGQYGNFARVCPLAGSQHTAAPPQGRAGGSSRGRSFPIQQQRMGETLHRPFQ
ncbi:ABC transporter C family member 13 [Dorcoceras hygrometricum]|uniref:ABC-type xenobiotic transporter n=1 Tax=Dorcoceras hygrometricum TaxID=472368 RepID=A0A2Z7BWY0_9LAMI|nr:ABC transporter C family member 13 [Dorcoceras hygrometricum]